MADPFATVNDLEARWRPLTTEEADRAAVLLVDASAVLRAEVPGLDARLAADPPLDADLPVVVVCSMVKRAMLASVGGDGVSSAQQSVGPFSTSTTFTNPLGNMYVTKTERRMLGDGGPHAFTIDPTPPAIESASETWW